MVVVEGSEPEPRRPQFFTKLFFQTICYDASAGIPMIWLCRIGIGAPFKTARNDLRGLRQLRRFPLSFCALNAEHAEQRNRHGQRENANRNGARESFIPARRLRQAGNQPFHCTFTPLKSPITGHPGAIKTRAKRPQL